jgi:RNA recognition motif-containing protein
MSATLYVDGLPTSISRPELKGMFSQFGKVLTIETMKAHTPQSGSIAIVEMETLDEAMTAVRSLHRSYLSGKFLLVFHGTTGTEATNGFS